MASTSQTLISSWEFLTTLSYEWSVIRGHRPYRWPIWIYSLTRIHVDTVATDIVGCHVFSHFPISTASILINFACALAIWNRNKVVVAIAAIIWFANSAILIEGTVQVNNQFQQRGICSAYPFAVPRCMGIRSRGLRDTRHQRP
ncbi:hypothetical protein BC826DRAFT_1047314 [Russula brevipes]|nr:hypothetical protein BC826DRAFT_1047314 [Russula brevipes]